MGQPKGHTPRNALWSKYPIADALESLGAAHQLAGDRFTPVAPDLAQAHRRLAKAYWQEATAIRAEAQEKAA